MFPISILAPIVAHPFAPHEGSWWAIEPPITVGVIVMTALYLYAVGPLRRRWGEHVDKRQVIMFLLAMLIVFGSLQGPLHELGDYYLFSAHMVQHLLVTMIMPPLLLKGIPGWLVDRALRLPLVLPIARFITSPFIAFAIFNIVFSLWHVPSFYQMALGNPPIHGLEHILFMGTALLTWWPIFSQSALLPRLSEPWQIFYLFAQSLIPTVLGALITFADFVIYEFYAAAPRVIALPAIEDQQISGLIMWLGGASIVLLVLTVRFFQYMERDSDESLEATGV
ncbi:MAG TPA: cytochrome c oxidase assembly protein [Herpetosiphonaceae bacterium]